MLFVVSVVGVTSNPSVDFTVSVVVIAVVVVVDVIVVKIVEVVVVVVVVDVVVVVVVVLDVVVVDVAHLELVCFCEHSSPLNSRSEHAIFSSSVLSSQIFRTCSEEQLSVVAAMIVSAKFITSSAWLVSPAISMRSSRI